MATKRAMVVGGGLAGLAAAMKLAELGVEVDLMSLTPVKRSHSVCAQGGINSVNEHTRQLGDDEWQHFDDTVYGGDFLQHQPPVREMAYAAPRIIELMDRLGVTFNRTQEGYLDRRRFGGTLFKRTAFAGATTGQQLMYALDEQVRRWETEGIITKYEFWEFLGPILDDHGVCRGCVAQDLVTMEIRAFPADALIIASGGCGLIFGRSTMSMVCTGSAVSRCYQAGAKYGNGEFIQVHPTAIPGADKLRLMSESARGEGGRVWVPRSPQDARDPRQIPENERYYFLEDRYPEYGNLVPRDIATREIFDICVNEGLSVDRNRQCVYLDLTHISRQELDRKLGGILEIYEKFQGVDPRDVPMKIFPAVHYSMGGLWADYERSSKGGLVIGSPENQATNVPGLFAIGECDYQFHGANRLGANSLLSCIFSGLIVAPGVQEMFQSQSGGAAAQQDASLFESSRKLHQDRQDELLRRPAGSENPYQIHLELGDVMTRSATVVRRNDQLREAYDAVCELQQRAEVCSLSDTGNWTNQNVVFTKALQDMFPVAKTILKGALQRDECRGAHFKPDFAMPALTGESEAERREQAEAWCDRFEANNRKWLKSTIAQCTAGEPEISYEDVDTSMIPPRPRLYGLAGAEVIEEAWKQRMEVRARLGRGGIAGIVESPANGELTSTMSEPSSNGQNTPDAFDVRVLRQDEPGLPSYWERHRVQREPDMNVISVLQRMAANSVTIEGKHVAPVAWDCNCLEEICGACTMLINGSTRQACSALVDQLLKDRPHEIELQPVSKFPVVRDLVVDRARLFRALHRVRAWMPIDGYYDMGAGPNRSQAWQEETYPLSQCMSCGCCLEACPQYLKVDLTQAPDESEADFAHRKQEQYDQSFLGAHAISQAVLFNSHPVGKHNADERLDALMAEGGIQICGNAQNCVAVCPKAIPLTTSIARAGRATTFHMLRRWFDK